MINDCNPLCLLNLELQEHYNVVLRNPLQNLIGNISVHLIKYFDSKKMNH